MAGRCIMVKLGERSLFGRLAMDKIWLGLMNSNNWLRSGDG